MQTVYMFVEDLGDGSSTAHFTFPDNLNLEDCGISMYKEGN